MIARLLGLCDIGETCDIHLWSSGYPERNLILDYCFCCTPRILGRILSRIFLIVSGFRYSPDRDEISGFDF